MIQRRIRLDTLRISYGRARPQAECC